MDLSISALIVFLGRNARSESSTCQCRRRGSRGGLLFLFAVFHVLSFGHPGIFPEDQPTLPDAVVQRLEKRLQRQPDNAGCAAQLAHYYLDRHARESGETWLQSTRRVLSFWMPRNDAPAQVLREIARYHQRVHQFENALQALDRLILIEPRDPQAWLDQSSALTTLGRYEEALAANQTLSRLKADPFLVIADRCAIMSRNGQAAKSLKALQLAFSRLPPPEPAIAAWAHGIQAETADRLGLSNQARDELEKGLRLQPADPYLLLSLARQFDRCGDRGAILDLLPADSSHEGIRLQRILALDPKETSRADLVLRLDEDFQKGHREEAHPHLREEAVFALRVLNDPERALRCAKANWDMQREPEDLEIYLEVLHAFPEEHYLDERAALENWLRDTGLQRRTDGTPSEE